MSIDELRKALEKGLKEGKSLKSLKKSLVDEGNNTLDVDIAASHISKSGGSGKKHYILFLVLGIIVLSALVTMLIIKAPVGEDLGVYDNQSVNEKNITSNNGVENTLPEFIPIPIKEGDFSSFRIDKIRYLFYDTPDEYGDISALRKVPGVYMYDANLEVWYSYFLPTRLEGADIYLKVVGRSTTDELDTVRFSGPLEDNGAIINFVSGLKSSQENPRLNYCFGFGEDFDPFEESDFVYCSLVVGTAPVNNLVASSSSLSFKFDVDGAENGDVLFDDDSVYITNSGTTPLTVFAAFEDIEGQEIELVTEDLPLDLLPEKEERIFFNASFTYQGTYAKDAGVYIFALPSNCNVSSYACGAIGKAKIKMVADYKI